MIKLIKYLVLISLCLISALISAQEKKWTLQECVNYALENNISIQQSELNVLQGEIDKKDAFGNFLPSFNASANHSWNIGLNQNITTGLLENLTTQFTAFGLNSNVTIYNGLRNVNQLHRANLAILANQYQLSDMKDDISLLVANSYLQILFNKEQLKIQKAQYDFTNQDYIRTEELVKEGVLPRGDALEIRATLASQEQQMVNTENALLLSKISLAQTLRLDDYLNFDTEDVSYNVPLSSVLEESSSVIVEKAKERRYDLKIAEANVKLAEYDLKLAKGSMQPRLSGFYRYDTRASDNEIVVGSVPDGTNRPIGFVEGTNQTVVTPGFSRVIENPDPLFDQFSRNDGHAFGLSLNLPILNGFSAKNNVQRNKVNLERLKHQYEQAELDLETEVYQAINDAKGALKAYEAAIKTQEARNEAFKYAKERYNLGVSNSFDFSQSQARYEQAQNEVVRTKYDYIFRLKVIEFYFGIPIGHLSEE